MKKLQKSYDLIAAMKWAFDAYFALYLLTGWWRSAHNTKKSRFICTWNHERTFLIRFIRTFIKNFKPYQVNK